MHCSYFMTFPKNFTLGDKIQQKMMIQKVAPREICFSTQQLDVVLMNGSKIRKFASFGQPWDIISVGGNSVWDRENALREPFSPVLTTELTLHEMQTLFHTFHLCLTRCSHLILALWMTLKTTETIGAPGWLSWWSVWLGLRIWSHGSRVWAQGLALCCQRRAHFGSSVPPLSAPPLLALSFSLSLSKINKHF